MGFYPKQNFVSFLLICLNFMWDQKQGSYGQKTKKNCSVRILLTRVSTIFKKILIKLAHHLIGTFFSKWGIFPKSVASAHFYSPKFKHVIFTFFALEVDSSYKLYLFITKIKKLQCEMQCETKCGNPVPLFITNIGILK